MFLRRSGGRFWKNEVLSVSWGCCCCCCCCCCCEVDACCCCLWRILSCCRTFEENNKQTGMKECRIRYTVIRTVIESYPSEMRKELRFSTLTYAETQRKSKLFSSDTLPHLLLYVAGERREELGADGAAKGGSFPPRPQHPLFPLLLRDHLLPD